MAWNIEKGSQLYRAMREELTSRERGLGWADQDLHDLFDCFNYGREKNIGGAFVRYDIEAPELNMIVPAVDPVSDSVVEQALDLIDKTMARRQAEE